MDDERTKLVEYRAEVVAELNKRAERVKRVEQEISSQEFLLESNERGRGVLTGDTTRVLVQASYRSRLKRHLERLKRERSEAHADLARAEQRLHEVEAELDELEEAELRESVENAEGESTESESGEGETT